MSTSNTIPPTEKGENNTTETVTVITAGNVTKDLHTSRSNDIGNCYSQSPHVLPFSPGARPPPPLLPPRITESQSTAAPFTGVDVAIPAPTSTGLALFPLSVANNTAVITTSLPNASDITRSTATPISIAIAAVVGDLGGGAAEDASIREIMRSSSLDSSTPPMEDTAGTSMMTSGGILNSNNKIHIPDSSRRKSGARMAWGQGLKRQVSTEGIPNVTASTPTSIPTEEISVKETTITAVVAAAQGTVVSIKNASTDSALLTSFPSSAPMSDQNGTEVAVASTAALTDTMLTRTLPVPMPTNQCASSISLPPAPALISVNKTRTEGEHPMSALPFVPDSVPTAAVPITSTGVTVGMPESSNVPLVGKTINEIPTVSSIFGGIEKDMPTSPARKELSESPFPLSPLPPPMHTSPAMSVYNSHTQFHKHECAPKHGDTPNTGISLKLVEVGSGGSFRRVLSNSTPAPSPPTSAVHIDSLKKRAMRGVAENNTHFSAENNLPSGGQGAGSSGGNPLRRRAMHASSDNLGHMGQQLQQQQPPIAPIANITAHAAALYPAPESVSSADIPSEIGHESMEICLKADNLIGLTSIVNTSTAAATEGMDVLFPDSREVGSIQFRDRDVGDVKGDMKRQRKSEAVAAIAVATGAGTEDVGMLAANSATGDYSEVGRRWVDQ